jgi:hypothetical protein
MNSNSPLYITFKNMELEGKKTIGFGKYRGSTYEEVYMYDRAYCRWCLSVDAKTFSMYDFQSYIDKINRLS